MAEIVKLGFAPLVDCAIPVAAAERGFAVAEGIDLVLERAPSWAALRDRLAFGLVDAAHILAPLALALHQGIAGVPATALQVPVSLGLGNNAITLSLDLYERMMAVAPEVMAGAPSLRARALRPIIDADRAAGKPLLSFVTVFHFSCHHYELLKWLADGGIDGRSEVNIGVIAPPRMVESLASGWIDGYCAGEPWNQRAMQRGVGQVVVTKADIRPDGLEKVLGLRTEWAEENPAQAAALVRAVVKAADWCGDPANRGELARLLAEARHVGLPADLIELTLKGAIPAPNRNRPDPADVEKLLAEMAAAGQLELPEAERAGLAAAVWRPDLYDEAMGC
ncbi:CmpA/NrtA family ABC transporter substrate-binding protein [Niveispirillum sp. KHB5.9]|uniref:CmpA/NrtA family ABC transporter substrate-binding protein n=1 Tax=Niveispirillum sp. KHB5.9 TaxID=3400269 RepID=UPI003A8AF14F